MNISPAPSPNLHYPLVFHAWAEPIVKQQDDGRIHPLVFDSDLPPAPTTDATFTFLDETGRILPHPNLGAVNLPPFCYVQHVEKMPPPPPPGYRYVRSVLNKKVSSPEFHYYHEIGSVRYGIDTPNLAGFAYYQLTPHQQSNLTSALVEHREGYLLVETNALVTNYTITPNALLTEIGANNVQIKKLIYSVQSAGKQLVLYEQVSIEDLERLPERIRSKHPGCLNSMQYNRIDAHIVFHLRSALNQVPEMLKFVTSGWHFYQNQWFYAQDDAALPFPNAACETNFRIARDPSLSPLDAMASAMRMLHISHTPSVIVPIILYAHLSVLYSLFEEAGFSPRTLLFINGKTGSLKTALCSLVFNLTGSHQLNIPATFRDTVASIEAKFPDYADKTLLVDDFCPAATSTTRSAMNKLLEALIRYFGDGKGRGRSNVTVTKSSVSIPRGLCCITGEDTGGSQSSLLRCLLIDVGSDTFDGKLLSVFQNDPRRWTTHFGFFTEFVAQQFDDLVNDIRCSFPSMRDDFSKILTAGRSIDTAVSLCIVAKLLLLYGYTIGWCSEENIKSCYSNWRSAVLEAVKHSEDVSSDLDPVKCYISALFEAVDSGTEMIAPTKEIFSTNTSVLGYERNGFLHLWPDRVFALAVKKCQIQKKSFPLSMTKIHAALAEVHLIETSKENRKNGPQINYLCRESFGSRPRMLVLNKEAAKKHIED